MTTTPNPTTKTIGTTAMLLIAVSFNANAAAGRNLPTSGTISIILASIIAAFSLLKLVLKKFEEIDQHLYDTFGEKMMP